jgi:hypothetical protein
MNYQKSKIYAIKCKERDDVYIGSTTRPLYVRMSEHRADVRNVMNGRKLYKKNTSMLITQYPSAWIELIEEFPCNNKEELHKREFEIMKETKCVNRINPITNMCRCAENITFEKKVAEVVL